MPIDPHFVGLTFNNRTVSRVSNVEGELAAIRRGNGGGGGGGGAVSGSVVTGTVPGALASNTAGTPQWAGLGLGAAATGGVSLTISQPTHTNPILVDTAGGGDWTSTPDGARYEIRHGSVGSRWTVSAPTMRLISYREQAMDISDHQDPNVYSTFLSMARGAPAHSVALQAGAFYTQNLSTVTPDYVTTNTDSQAVSGIGEVATGGKGRAIGGFFYSWIDSDADPAAKGSGVEAVVENRIVANDHSVEISGTGAGSKSMCAFVVAKGPSRVATGIQLGADVTGSMQCGFYAPFRSSGTVIEEATYRDYGQAEHSLDIGGVHSKAAIGIGPGSNGIVIGRGSKTAFAALDLGWQSDGVTPTTTYTGGVLFGNDTSLYRVATNTLRTGIFQVGGVGVTHPTFQVDADGTQHWGPGGATATNADLGWYAAGILRSTTTSLSVPNITLSSPTGQLPQDHRFECRVGSQAAPSTNTGLRCGEVIQYFGDMAAGGWGDQSGWSNTWEWKNTTADVGDNMLGVRSTVNYGGSITPVAARGTAHAFTGAVVIQGAGVNATNSLPGEQAAYFGAVLDETTGSAQSGGPWGFDMGVHGTRSSVTQRVLYGYALRITQYQSASPTSAPSAGSLIATGPGAGPWTGVTASHPIDYGLQIMGVSGTTANENTSSATQGFKIALGIGGSSSVWCDFARFGTGIDLQGYENYGIRIWKRWAGSTGPSLSVGWDTAGSASFAAADGIDFAGTVALHAGAANVLHTPDAFGITQTAVPGTPAGTGFYFGNTGIMEVMRVGSTGAFYRVYGNAADTSTNPTFRMRITASNVELAWSAVGGASLDTTIARAGVGRLHVANELSAATGVVGGIAGAPTGGLDTATFLVTRRVTPTWTTGNNNDVVVAKSFATVSGSTAGIVITGIAGGVDGVNLTLVNVNSNTVQVNHQDTASTAANRFFLKGAANVTMTATLSAMQFRYDSTIGGTGAWVEVSRNL